MFAAVVTTLRTHMVWALDGLALRAFLKSSHWRTLRGVAEALALLGYTAFRDGHETASRSGFQAWKSLRVK